VQLQVAENMDALRTELIDLVQPLNVYESHATRT
jgi:hypothetical protein